MVSSGVRELQESTGEERQLCPAEAQPLHGTPGMPPPIHHGGCGWEDRGQLRVRPLGPFIPLQGRIIPRLERTWNLVPSFVLSFIHPVGFTKHQLRLISFTRLPHSTANSPQTHPSSRLPNSMSSSPSTPDENNSQSFSSIAHSFVSTTSLLLICTNRIL